MKGYAYAEKMFQDVFNQIHYGLTGGIEHGAHAAVKRFTPQTGCAGRREMFTTWRVSCASLVRGSCQQARSLLWLDKNCCVAFITTACWTNSKVLLRKVS